MKVSTVRKTIEKVLELIGLNRYSWYRKRKCNQKYINKSYDMLYDLREQIIKEKSMKNIEKTTEKW